MARIPSGMRKKENGLFEKRFTVNRKRYIEEGGNMQTLKKILGHSSLAMTADLYAHVLPDTKQQEMNQIESAFIGVAVL